MMYYYRRKTSPWKWVLIILILAAIGVLGWWFYVNYFSKIEIAKPMVEPTPEVTTAPVKTLNASLAMISGDVLLTKSGKTESAPAIADTVLHQGDKIEIGNEGYAVLKIENGAIVRLGANSAVILQDLSEKNIILEQLKGRTYNNIPSGINYQIKSLKGAITSIGTKFEVITNDVSQIVTVLVMESQVKAEIIDNQELVIGGRLDANEKATMNFKLAKNEMLKIEKFDIKLLVKESWYKWNFDLDQGIEQELADQEPNFQAISDSLALLLTQSEEGVKLSWTAYNQDNFKEYKIIRSETNAELKYPDQQAIKSSIEKTLSAYLDKEAKPGKKYYYRICVVKDNDKVACGNAANIELKKEDDGIPPAAPNLSASISVSGVTLSWTKNSETDFKEYKVLKAIAYVPQYSKDIVSTKYSGSESYLDSTVNITSAGIVYYQVCSADTFDNHSCSKVIQVENGAVK